jgi:hypothetical protein
MGSTRPTSQVQVLTAGQGLVSHHQMHQGLCLTSMLTFEGNKRVVSMLSDIQTPLTARTENEHVQPDVTAPGLTGSGQPGTTSWCHTRMVLVTALPVLAWLKFIKCEPQQPSVQAPSQDGTWPTGTRCSSNAHCICQQHSSYTGSRIVMSILYQLQQPHAGAAGATHLTPESNC